MDSNPAQRMDALERLKQFRYKKQQEEANGTSPLTTNPAYRNVRHTPTHVVAPKKEPAILVLASSDAEPDDDSDADLSSKVNNMSTGSPLRRSSPKPSTPSFHSPSSTSPTLHHSHSGQLAAGPQRLSTVKPPTSSSVQGAVQFKSLVGAFRYQGDGASSSSPVPVPGESDHDLSSPEASDGDVVMSDDRPSSKSNQSSSKSTKRIMIRSDDDDEHDESTPKPRRRLVRKGGSVPDEDEQNGSSETKKRRVKRVIIDSDDEEYDKDIAKAVELSLASNRSSRSPTKWVSDEEELGDDILWETAMDRTLAKLQTSFPNVSFSELKKTLKESGGDYSAAASRLAASSSLSLFDLSASPKKTFTSSSSSPASPSSPSSPHSRFNTMPKSEASTSAAKPVAPFFTKKYAASSPSKSVVQTIRKKPIVTEERKRKPIVVNEVSSDDGGEDDYDGPTSSFRAQDRKEERALQFFNESTQLELQELSGCSKSQANLVLGLRPFDNFDQLCVILRKTKGVGEKIVNNYLTTTDAIRAVDMMLKTVDRVREDLVGTLSVWCGEEHGQLFANATSSNSMEVKEKNDEDEEEDDQPGMELLDINIDKLEETSAGRKAMEGFIRRQPKNMAPGFQLKGYQLLGINWLALLWRKKLSGILADEMGLGKTAQVIAFLAHLKNIDENGPFLIIVPSSTLSNWLREFEKFCPELDVRSYYGTQAEREELREELENDPTYDVVVTTYTVATGNNDERKFLNRRNFKGIVLDEGHMVKNCTSMRYKQLMSIKTPFRLLLTGTPLQNNLEELLSLMIFIMPKLFAEHEEVLRTMFKVKVDAQSEKSTLLSQERISRARLMLAPFVLRRKKIHVLKDLPKKVERVIYCDLDPDQRALYDKIIVQNSETIQLDEDSSLDTAAAALSAVELDGLGPKAKEKAIKAAVKKPSAAAVKKGNNELANVLMQLRKAADHPMLFRELYKDSDLKKMAKAITKEIEFCDSNIDYIEEDMSVMTDFELHRLCKQYKSVNKFALPGDQWMRAGKVKELQRLLPKLINDDKSRILIFSQFTMVLDILEPVMKTMGFKYLRLDGATKVEERQPMIDSFNDDDSNKVFLLSTKAGGFGINLIGANVVIMYDLDYNPHNDKQAEDRAHRVGQTREVEVIRLLGKDTIEEQIYQLANLKLKLDHHVSNDDAALAAAAGGTGGASDNSSSASGSSTPSAGILSLFKQNWKATHSAALTRQEEKKATTTTTPASPKDNVSKGSYELESKATKGKGKEEKKTARSRSVSSSSSLSDWDDDSS